MDKEQIEKNLPKIKDSIRLLYETGNPESIKAAKNLEKQIEATHPEIIRELQMTNTSTEDWLLQFITQDEEMLKLKDNVRKLSSILDPVLIVGETGTGKELIARALHGKRLGKFIPINCTALPDYLLESELYGHKKGSFTGAVDDRMGLFEAAGEGTIFLDEIGDMPIAMQVKLLRVLQDRMIRRVGDNIERHIKCRFIVATNQNLEKMVEEKRFRLDLLSRLNVFVLKIKSLAERGKDIPLIMKSLEKDVPEEVIEKVYKTENRQDGNIAMYLPGNVRNLQAIVRRWKVLGAENI